MIKKIKTLLLIVAIFCFTAVSVDAAPVDRIVAVVNDEVITLNQLDKRVAELKAVKKMSADGTLEAKRKILDGLIDQTLIQQAASKAGVHVSEREVLDAINDIRKRENLTEAQFQASLTKNGISYNSFKEDIRSEILRYKIMGSGAINKVVITDKEAIDFLKGSGVRQGLSASTNDNLVKLIIISASAPNDSRASALAKNIKKDLENGLPFSEVSKKYPDVFEDTTALSQLHPVLKKIAIESKIGEIKGPIDGGQSIVLLSVTNELAKQQQSGKKVKSGDNVYSQDEINMAKRQLEQMRLANNYEAWLKALKSKSSIKIML